MVAFAEILGVSLGLGSIAVCVTGLLVYRYVVTKRKKPPPSPDYSAVGDFKPPSLFSWDSATSISFNEESHTVQPRIKPHIGRQVSRDDVSIATNTTTASESSRDSFRESYKSRRVRTLSETSNCSVDSSNFDTSSIGIQPELYTRKNAVLRQESSVATLGRLHIRLKYDFRTSDLVVHLIEAQDLQPYDSVHGMSDPFIKIIMSSSPDHKTRQTSVKRATTNPLYNEYFKFPIGFDELRERTLGFYVYNYDRFSHHDLAGEVKIDFSTIDVSTVVEVWCDIEPASQGEEGLGDLLVSLSYLPTAERLTLVVMKARALKLPRASNAKIDPVVRVTLFHDNKPIKKKKSSVCKASSNPVWNEALVFNVPPASLDHVHLEIAVADHDLLGHSESLGLTTLGKGQPGVGGAHWKDMTANVRKAVAKWHVLH